MSKAEYITLQQKLVNALKALTDTNSNYTLGAASVPVFDPNDIFARSVNINDANFGLESSQFIGQDSGDVYALLSEGYNFDGLQPGFVSRLGDTAPTSTTLATGLAAPPRTRPLV